MLPGLPQHLARSLLSKERTTIDYLFFYSHVILGSHSISIDLLFFFFILGLGWVVVWCRHELVFLLIKAAISVILAAPVRRQKVKVKIGSLKTFFKSWKIHFSLKTSDLQSWPSKVDAMQPRRRREQPPDVLAADPAVDPLKYYLDKRTSQELRMLSPSLCIQRSQCNCSYCCSQLSEM